MRICRNCSVLAPDSETRCPQCGAALLPATAADLAANSKPHRFPLLFWYLGFGVFVAILALYGWSNTSPSANTAAGPKTLRAAYFCAVDHETIYPVLSAIRNQDREALAGLILRQKAYTLAAGTSVYVAHNDGEISAVLIESGRHSGQTCYLPTAALE